jgi:hypothetical protein
VWDVDTEDGPGEAVPGWTRLGDKMVLLNEGEGAVGQQQGLDCRGELIAMRRQLGTGRLRKVEIVKRTGQF